MQTKKILLAGATGYLGRYIAQELSRKNYPTKILVRNKAKITSDMLTSQIIIAGVTQANSLKGTMYDVDTVISTVGITKQKDGLSYMDVDYQANINLLREAQTSGVRKFIYVSALNGDMLTHLKMTEAKERFVKELENSGLQYCIIRPNGFFSDMSEFLKMAEKGSIKLFGDGNFKMNPIHGADLAEVIIDAIHSEHLTIEVGGPEIFTHNEIANMAFDVINRKPKIKYMPEWIRKIILGLSRTFTSSKTYGPLEFFFTVLSMDMIAPKYGKHTLYECFSEINSNK